MKYWNNGFYDRPKEGGVEITDERYEALMYGQAHKQLAIRSDAAGVPQLYRCDGELFAGDVYTYDHTAEPDYIAAQRRREVEGQIAALKAELATTDYKVVKNHEYIDAGQPPYYDPMALFNEREPLRRQIRDLENL